MTRLHDLLDQIADQAAPADDLAGRALRKVARRRRLRLPVTLAAATSVAVVLALVAFAVPVLIGGTVGGQDPATGSAYDSTVRFPDQAPDLPAKGVEPVRLTYRMSCKGPDGRSRDCASWRVLTTGGRHYRVQDAPDPGETGGNSGVIVSPDGRRIAYLRADGSFVLRDLASGDLTTLFRWDRAVSSSFQHSHAWSPDGRWLLLVPGTEGCRPLPDGGCSIQRFDEPTMLVDTKTLRTVRIGDGSGQAYGLSDDDVFPFGGVEHPAGVLPLLDHTGAVKATLPSRLMPGRNVDGMLAHISPDGRTLAVITFPKNKPSDVDGGAPLITLIDVESARIARDFRIKRNWQVWDSPRFLGWQDNRTALVMTRTLTGRIPAHPGEGFPTNVDAIDVVTGAMHRVLRLPDLPEDLDLAYDLL